MRIKFTEEEFWEINYETPTLHPKHPTPRPPPPEKQQQEQSHIHTQQQQQQLTTKTHK